MSIWHETDGDYSAEHSDLEANNCLNSGRVVLPGGGLADFNRFKAVRDEEGDILYWFATVDGIKYTIFND